MRSDQTRIRIAVICHDGDAINRQILPRWVSSFACLVGLVSIREQSGALVKRLRAERRRVGALRLLDVFAFRVYYGLFVAGADERWQRDQLMRLDSELPSLPQDLDVHVTADPNDDGTREYLAACQPDIVLARCSWLLAKKIYSIPRLGTFVLHPGVCPEYRNAHGCFWALVKRDVERVGMTLLRIDDGVDTGPPYAYFTYPYDERAESHVRIQYRMFLENLDAIRSALSEIAAGRLEPIDVAGRKSGVWGQPWLSAYLSWKRAARKTVRQC